MSTHLGPACLPEELQARPALPPLPGKTEAQEQAMGQEGQAQRPAAAAALELLGRQGLM
jgi:hypothetical protein